MEDINSIVSEQEEAFRAKADHYIVCFVEHCPLREQCLRWLVGRYADPLLYAVMSINPFYPGVGTQQCSRFRDSRRVMLKYGFTRLYDDMPPRIAKPIRQRLYVCFGRPSPPTSRNRSSKSAANAAGRAPSSMTASRKGGRGSVCYRKIIAELFGSFKKKSYLCN